MSHVFISYSRKNSDFVNKLREEFARRQLECWIDVDKLPEHAGEDWCEEIDKAIEDAYLVLFLLSPDANRSINVTYEWAYARGHGKTIIPVLVEPFDHQSPLHSIFARTQQSPIEKDRDWDILFARIQELEKPTSLTYSLSRNAPIALKNAVQRLDSHQKEEREQAIQSLFHFAENNVMDAFKILGISLQHWDKSIRHLAAYYLAALNRPESIELLNSLLGLKTLIEVSHHHANSDMRYATREAIGQLSNPELVPLLSGLLQRTMYYQFAIQSLRRINSPESINAIHSAGFTL